MVFVTFARPLYIFKFEFTFNDEAHVVALFNIVVPFNNEFPLTFNDETHVVAFNNDILLLEFIIIAPAPAPDCNIKFPILHKILSPDIADDEKAPGVDETP